MNISLAGSISWISNEEISADEEMVTRERFICSHDVQLVIITTIIIILIIIVIIIIKIIKIIRMNKIE